MLLQEFLTLILPDEGIKCWVSIHDKKVSQGFADNIPDLATVVQGIDALQKDAYFACASFKEPGNRKRENALSAKAFWLDIDAGEGKPYANAEVAIAALETFTDKINAPLPIVVRSGNGVHAYWILDAPLPAAEWQRAASLFKQVVAFHGLHADPSRTADIASILRVPGTQNWKNKAAPKPVYIEYEDFDTCNAAFFINLPVPPSAMASSGSILSHLVGQPRQAAPDMQQGIPDGQGRTEGMMKRIGWCLGPGKMTFEQATAALLAWNQLNQPPLDVSKIQAAIANIYSKEAQKAIQKREDSPVKDEDLTGIPKAPWPYRWTEKGSLVHDTKDLDGEPAIITISEYPIYLANVACRENEYATSYCFRLLHPKGGWREFFVRADEFIGQAGHGILTYHGADISDIKKFKHAVHGWAVELKGKKMDEARYGQFGWKEDGSFLLGNLLYKTGEHPVHAYGDEKLHARMRAMEVPRGGSLEAWTASANRFYALGMEAFGFSLLASFAAPLMEFCIGESEGGAILALHSGASGRGKTRTLEGIASVWGKFDALGTIGADTNNARFAIITNLRNLPVLYDELTEMDPMILRKFFKEFTTGREKNRAQRDGSVQIKENRFKTILISASNNSVLETVRASNDAGAVARIFEIEMEVTDSREFDRDRMEQTLRAMSANRGFAGQRFIEVLQLPGMLPKVQDMLDKAKTHFQKTLNTTPDDRYVAHLLSTMLVAAKIVTDYNILSFDIKRIMDWGTIRARDRISSAYKANPIQALALYISEHIQECLTASGPVKNRHTPIRIPFIPPRTVSLRNELETQRLYISIQSFQQWAMKKHLTTDDIAKALIAKGILISNGRMVTLTAGADMAPVRLACWEIDTAHPEVSGSVQVVTAQSEVSPAASSQTNL